MANIVTSHGEAISSTPAALVVNQPPSLATALNTPNLTWMTSGNANWYVQTTNTHDNVDAAQSGRIADSQESRMETTLNGPATVAFWWRVDSELNYDFLRVELDDRFGDVNLWNPFYVSAGREISCDRAEHDQPAFFK